MRIICLIIELFGQPWPYWINGHSGLVTNSLCYWDYRADSSCLRG